MPVGVPGGGQLRDPQLAGGERVAPPGGVAAGPASGDYEFTPGPGGHGEAARRVG